MPFAQNRFVVIYNGIASPDLVSREQARAHVRAQSTILEHLWFGSVAELHPNKRLDLLIEAFANVSSEFPDSALLFIGDGEERGRLQALAGERNLLPRVHFAGAVHDAERYLKALDIFVLPSHTEALGLAIIEAGFASLPVIATRVGGIPEIIDDTKNGILFERGNVQDLTAALKKLLASPSERARLGTALHEKVAREFSLEKMVEQTTTLYT
jgi:glycosyltransferase involved in cell wall biosynthesis